MLPKQDGEHESQPLPSRSPRFCSGLWAGPRGVLMNTRGRLGLESFRGSQAEPLTAAQERRRREHACPQCGSREIERVPRRGVLDRLVRLVGRRVYLCRACRCRFYDRPIAA